MKKVFLVLARVFAALAALAFGISLLLPGIVDQTALTTPDVPTSSADTMFGAFIQVATPQSILVFLGFAFVGCALVLFGQNIAKKIGYACEFVSGFFALFVVVEILNSIKNEPKMSIGFGAILALIGLLIISVGVVLELLYAFISGIEQKKDVDDTIETILKYKQLLNQDIITEDIFLKKRDELLGISQKENESAEKE